MKPASIGVYLPALAGDAMQGNWNESSPLGQTLSQLLGLLSRQNQIMSLS